MVYFYKVYIYFYRIFSRIMVGLFSRSVLTSQKPFTVAIPDKFFFFSVLWRLRKSNISTGATSADCGLGPFFWWNNFLWCNFGVLLMMLECVKLFLICIKFEVNYAAFGYYKLTKNWLWHVLQIAAEFWSSKSQ